MKKYLLFVYDNYYPQGGMEDLYAESDSLEELKALLRERETYPGRPYKISSDNTYIVDRDTDENLWENGEDL